MVNRKENNMRWALVNTNNIVDNVVIWDGGGDLFQGTTNVHLADNEACAPGWTYDPNSDPRFVEPEVLEIP
jgi:hypothetical protein